MKITVSIFALQSFRVLQAFMPCIFCSLGFIGMTLWPDSFRCFVTL